MSLGLSALIVVGGIFIGRFWARRARERAQGPGSPPSAEVTERLPSDATPSFPCQLGDVIVRRAERDEAWLAGALLFEENDAKVGVLFIAPDRGPGRAVYARDGSADLVWLVPLSQAPQKVGREPPSTVEHDGVRFERRRRLPVQVEAGGHGAPSVGVEAVVAEYVGPGTDRIVVVAGRDEAFAWVGVVLAENEYDVLPGGPSTLE